MVNALPPLKWCSFWANPFIDELSAQGPVPTPWILLFSLDSVEPHRVTSNDLVGALGAGPRPEGVGRPAAWSATVSRRCHSVDVFQRGRFLFPRQPLTSPLPKEQLQSTRSERSVADVRPFIIIGFNRRSDPASGVPPAPDHGLKLRGLRRVQTVRSAPAVHLGPWIRGLDPFPTSALCFNI